MARVNFRTQIHGELAGAIDALADRYARFGIPAHEVHELCLYQGITKTRAEVERMEQFRAAGVQPYAGALAGA